MVLMTSATAINVYQERDFYLLQLQSNLQDMRWVLHELWANLDQLREKHEKKSRLKESIIRMLESKLIRCTRELKRYLDDDSLPVDYITKKKTVDQEPLETRIYEEKTGRGKGDFDELHPEGPLVTSLNFDYQGALMNAMNGGKRRVKRNIIGEALQFVTRVAGPTEVEMDHKQFAAIEIEQARINNITLGEDTNINLVSRQVTRQETQLQGIKQYVVT